VAGSCKCGCGKPTFIANRTRAEYGWIKGHPVNYARGHNGKVLEVDRIFNFWSRIHLDPVTGCLEWKGPIGTRGYGAAAEMNGHRVAHKASYTLFFGRIPKGLEPDHLCRNRKCVNPMHLELVTRKINARRGAKAKLTFQQADEIKSSIEPTRILMHRYGVSRSTIKGVRSGRHWS
jgi:hypothetical protein